MEKIKAIIILVLFIIIHGAYGQSIRDTANISSKFNIGIQLYNSSKYEEADSIFNDIINNTVFNSQTTIAYLFEGKALAKLNKFDKSRRVLTELLEKFPDSRYNDEARLTLAQISLEQKNYLGAFLQLVYIIDSSGDVYYLNYSKSSAEKIALNYLSPLQLNSVYDSVAGNKSRPFVLLTLGKYYLENDNSKEAGDIFTKLLKLYPDSEEKTEAATLINNISTGYQLDGSPVIAAFLPLNYAAGSDEFKTISEILEGIKFAFSEFNNSSDKKIGLLIENTGRNKEQIIKLKNELSKINRLKAIIGPVFSDEVKETLDIFKDSGLPVISPTATDDSLTFVYNNFFQANPSFLMRGKILAEYIYFVENKKNMAVLNSIDNYSSNIAAAFSREFEKLGGNIITHQTYNSDSLNFDSQVEQIAADSLKLDGVFIPLFNKSIVPVLLSQFVKYNFDLPLYGNQDWFLAKGYETYPALSNKLTFSSDYYLDYSDTAFSSFCSRFTLQTGKEVTRFVLYGYDAAEYLLKNVNDFTAGESVIKNEIEQGAVFNGFHNNISFGSDRVNKFLNIIRYKDGKFELVDKFKYSK